MLMNHYGRPAAMTALSYIAMFTFKDLCRKIVDGQNAEIEQMKSLLVKKSGR